MQFYINPIMTLLPNYTLELESSSSADHQANAGRFEQTVRLLNATCIPATAFLGLALNVVSCVTMCGSRMSSSETYVPYLVWLSVSDSAFLLSLLVVWSTSVGLTDLYARDGWCLTVTYFSGISTFLAPWYTVCMTVDRVLVAVARSPPPPPPLMRSSSRRLRSNAVCAVLMLVAVSVYLNSSLIYGVVETRYGSLCVALPRYVSAAQLLAELELVFGVLVPSSSIVVFNVVTIVFLVGAREAETTYPGRDTPDLSLVASPLGCEYPLSPAEASPPHSSCEHSSPPSRPSDDLHVRSTLSIVLTTFVFLLLSLPAQLLQAWVILSSTTAERTFQVPKNVVLLQHLLLVVWYLRFGCNFPLLLAFNPIVYRKFRLLLKNTLSSKRTGL